jgi:hypothetical protein
MHLEGPWLTTTGKKKGKQKFRNAEQARKAREQAEAWQELLKRHGISESKKHKPKVVTLPTDPGPYRRETPHTNSLPFTGGPCLKPEQKVYTGTKMKGIGVMHKSNSVPIFSDEEAIDIAKMRR